MIIETSLALSLRATGVRGCRREVVRGCRLNGVPQSEMNISEPPPIVARLRDWWGLQRAVYRGVSPEIHGTERLTLWDPQKTMGTRIPATLSVYPVSTPPSKALKTLPKSHGHSQKPSELQLG